MTVKINLEKCQWNEGKCECGCCLSDDCCVQICPVDAIKREKDVSIDASTCIDCGACVEACPNDAISF